MADIRLISILPTPLAPGIAPSPQTTQGGTPLLLPTGLSLGTVLAGFIINRDAKGNPILRSDKGDVVFASDFFLKIGSEVTIRIENQGGTTLAKLLTVNGQPPEIATAQSGLADTPEVVVSANNSARPLTPAPAATIASSPAISASSPPPDIVTASIVAPPTTRATVPLPNGTPLAFIISAIDTPEQPAAPTLFLNNTPNTAPPYSAYAKSASTFTPATPVATATPTAVNIAAAPAVPVPTTGQSLNATVLRSDTNGKTLLQTPVGIVELKLAVPLATGAKLTLTITTPPAVPAPATAAAPLSTLARQWDALQQIVTLLGSPSIASTAPLPPLLTAAQPQAPNVPQNISAGLMVFIAALRGGNFTNWLGKENTEALRQKGHEELLRRAETEFTSIARQYNEPAPTQPWQMLFFPIAAEGHVQQVRIFTKRDRKRDDNRRAKADEDTRFVVECELSQLGALQMDGLVRRHETTLEFDLYIRSLKPIDAAMQQDILTIYNDIGKITGYQGNLVFQPVREFPVNPMEEVLAHTIKTVVA